jgi:chromosome segregation ATPase
LPANRAAMAEAQGKAFALEYQTVANQRDELQAELLRIKSDLQLAKVNNEFLSDEITMMRSRMADMTATRDEAVAYRAHYEAWFSQLDAQCRAFKPPAVPLVRIRNVGDNDTELG